MKRKPYDLPPEDRERLNASEMRAFRWSLAALNSVTYAKDDLSSRLECIPNGKMRWKLMVGSLGSILDDMIGTITDKQRGTILNTMKDMELRMVPKFTTRAEGCVIDAEDLGRLITHAKKDACTACIADGEECRKCELYKIFESITPLENYGDGTVCPYNMLEYQKD